MLKGWQGGTGAIVVTLGTVALIILDLTDRGFRLWWVRHALTTDTIAGVLVVLLTVLVVNQVVRRRQLLDRARAISAQAGMIAAQARRAAQVFADALHGSGDRDAARDAFRTYMVMLLVSSPVLIDARVSRDFLEEAQRLGGELARLLASLNQDGDAPPPSTDRLDSAVQRLQTASVPLMAQLTPEERDAVTGGGTS